MKVYIAMGIYQYEGGDNIFGVFTTEEKAREVAEKHRDRYDFVDVFEYTLDEEWLNVPASENKTS